MRRALRPLEVLLRVTWLDFKLATVNPLAPHFPAMVLERRALAAPVPSWRRVRV